MVVVERTISASGYASARAGMKVRAASTSPTLMQWTQSRGFRPSLRFGTNPQRSAKPLRYFRRVASRTR
ncbi:MAG: hypothetical protein AMK72_14095 [Planctomycetes bacterium SM23_25]|nr:MAG: hypothetical protein AMK72_14095 [Planctomycetes bacterium SM23_25]